MQDPTYCPEHVVRACALYNASVETDPAYGMGLLLGNMGRTPLAEAGAPFIDPSLVGQLAANTSELIAS